MERWRSTASTQAPLRSNLERMALNMSRTDVIAPKRKDRVESTDHQGIFEVMGVNSLRRTVNLRAVDASRPVIANVPWETVKSIRKKSDSMGLLRWLSKF